jgi:SAM-dependent methyltransferase
LPGSGTESPRATAPARPPATGLVGWLDRTLYPHQSDHWDDEIFRERILSHLTPAARVLEVGAGAGRVSQMDFRGKAARVVGVDPDQVVLANPYLHEAHVADAERLPLADGSFDVVFSDNVFEHVARPDAIFAEVFRVLAPGGVFLMKTPNRWHYVTVIARLTPFWFHRFVNRLRGRDPEHTFPTLYRANSPRQARALGEGAGFRLLSVEVIEGRPEYLRLSAPSYVLGWLYERLVNSTPRLERFRVVLVAVFRKPGGER